jgi:hypothetical protein
VKSCSSTPHRASTIGAACTARCRTGSISTCETRIGGSAGMLPSLRARISRRQSDTLG